MESSWSRLVLDRLKKQPVPILKDVLFGLPLTAGYLWLSVLAGVTCLALFINLNSSVNFALFSKYSGQILALPLIFGLFLGLGVWLCAVAFIEKHRLLRSLLHIPIFRIGLLSIVPSFIVWILGLQWGTIGFLIGFLSLEISCIWFFPAVLIQLWGKPFKTSFWQKDPERNALYKNLFKANLPSLLFGLLLVALGQAFIIILKQAKSPTPLTWLGLSLITILLLGTFLFSFHLAIHGFQQFQTEDTEPTEQKNAFISPFLAVCACLGAIMFVLNHTQQAQLNVLFQDLKSRMVAQQEQNKYMRPVLRGTAQPGNGDAAYWAIIGKEEGSNKEMVSFFQKNYPSLGQALSLDRLEIKSEWGIQSKPDLTEKYRPVIQALQAAAAHEYIQHDYGYSVDALLPNFINAQDLSRVMISLAMSRCEQGQCLEGGELLMDTLRLGQDIEYRGTLIDGMVGIVIKNMALRAGFSDLNHKSLKPEELQLLLSRMQTLLSSEKNLSHTMLNEFIMVEKIMSDFAEDIVGKKSTLLEVLGTSTSDGQNLELYSVFPVFKPIIIDAFKKLIPIKARVQEIYLLPRSQQKEQWNAFNSELEAMIQNNFFLSLSLPNLIGAWKREINDHLKLQGAYLSLALEAYHAKQGHYPEKQAALVPELIPALPIDPWTDKPFIYKRLPSGDYLFYSLGESGKLAKGFNYLDPAKQTCTSSDNVIFSNHIAAVSAEEKGQKPNCQSDIEPSSIQ